MKQKYTIESSDAKFQAALINFIHDYGKVGPDSIVFRIEPEPFKGVFHLDEQYENILKENDVKVIYKDNIFDLDNNRKPYIKNHSWTLTWKHGFISLGPLEDELTAKKSAALFVYLWLKDIPAEFAVECARNFAYIKTLEKIIKETRKQY